MRTNHGLGVVTFSALSALLLPACGLATASDGFEEYDGPLRCGSTGTVRDLNVRLTSFSAHSMNVMRGDIVRVDAGPRRVLVGRFVFDPGRTSDIDLVVPCILGAGEYELDLLADIDNSNTLSCPPLPDAPTECIDHQWRLPIQGDGTLIYTHDLRFDDVTDDPAPAPDGNLPMDVTLRNFEEYAGLPLEVHVRRLVATPTTPIRETVFVYRLAALPETGTLILPRPGTIVGAPAGSITANEVANLAVPEGDYEVVFWIDSNQNGTYEVPGGGEDRDVSWSTMTNTDVDGVHADFDASSAEALNTVDVGL